MIKSDIGLVGLAVMGENLALNLEQKGYRVSLYNRLRENSPQAVDSFLANKGKNKHFIGTHSPKEFIESLKSPRKILLMIRAGHPVDEMIITLLPFLKKGDTIIDGGNSDYRDTQRRENELREKGIFFVGCGISAEKKELSTGHRLCREDQTKSKKKYYPFYKT